MWLSFFSLNLESDTDRTRCPLGLRESFSFASPGRCRQRGQALVASVPCVVCILSHDMLLNTGGFFCFFFNLNYIVTIADLTFTIYKKKDDFIAFKVFYS